MIRTTNKMVFTLCYKSDKIMTTYKVLFWWGAVRRQAYYFTETLEDALTNHKKSEFAEHKIISIVEE